MRSEREWEYATKCILGMHLIASCFNDEEYAMTWLMGGVPDGTETLDDVKDLYPNDADFDAQFNELSELFCRLIADQTASVGEGGQIEFCPRAVIYVGQEIKQEKTILNSKLGII